MSHLDVPEMFPEKADSLQREGAVLIDVREDDEWEAGHAPAAVHMPPQRLPDSLNSLAGSKVLVICHTGARSALAASWLIGAGVDASNVAGGMASWARSSLPVVKDDGSPGTVI